MWWSNKNSTIKRKGKEDDVQRFLYWFNLTLGYIQSSSLKMRFSTNTISHLLDQPTIEFSQPVSNPLDFNPSQQLDQQHIEFPLIIQFLGFTTRFCVLLHRDKFYFIKGIFELDVKFILFLNLLLGEMESLNKFSNRGYCQSNIFVLKTLNVVFWNQICQLLCVVILDCWLSILFLILNEVRCLSSFTLFIVFWLSGILHLHGYSYCDGCYLLKQMHVIGSENVTILFCLVVSYSCGFFSNICWTNFVDKKHDTCY